MSNPDGAHIAHAYRHPLLRENDNVSDVLEGPDQAQPSHGIGLLAQRNALPTDVLVGVGDGGGELREGSSVTAQSIGVDLDVVFLGLPAKADHVDHPGNLFELPRDDPVLSGLQIAQ